MTTTTTTCTRCTRVGLLTPGRSYRVSHDRAWSRPGGAPAWPGRSLANVIQPVCELTLCGHHAAELATLVGADGGTIHAIGDWSEQ